MARLLQRGLLAFTVQSICRASHFVKYLFNLIYYLWCKSMFFYIYAVKECQVLTLSQEVSLSMRQLWSGLTSFHGLDNAVDGTSIQAVDEQQGSSSDHERKSERRL